MLYVAAAATVVVVAVAYLVASDFVEDLLELLGRDLVVAVAVVLEHRVQVINICEEVLQDLKQEFVFR